MYFALLSRIVLLVVVVLEVGVRSSPSQKWSNLGDFWAKKSPLKLVPLYETSCFLTLGVWDKNDFNWDFT